MKYRAREIRAMLESLTKIAPAFIAAADIIEDAEQAERTNEDITRTGLQQKALLEQEIEQLETKRVRIKASVEDEQKQHVQLMADANNKLSLIRNSVARAQAEHDQLVRRQQDESAETLRGNNEALRQIQGQLKLKEGELRKKGQEIAQAEHALEARKEEKRRVDLELNKQQQNALRAMAEAEENLRALNQELVGKRREKAGLDEDIRRAQGALSQTTADAENKKLALEREISDRRQTKTELDDSIKAAKNSLSRLHAEVAEKQKASDDELKKKNVEKTKLEQGIRITRSKLTSLAEQRP